MGRSSEGNVGEGTSLMETLIKRCNHISDSVRKLVASTFYHLTKALRELYFEMYSTVRAVSRALIGGGG